jgi:hypothetical protein
MHIDLILRSVFVLDFIINWGLGWRYLLSRNFRRRVHEKWKRRSRASVIADCVFAAVAFVIFNGFIVLVSIWLYNGIVAPRLHP